MKNTKTLKAKKGMTLIELIVTIMLIAVVGIFVMGFLTPLLKSYGDSAAHQQCVALADSTADAIARKLQYADSVSLGIPLPSLPAGETASSISLVARTINGKTYHDVYYDGAQMFKAESFAGFDIVGISFERIYDSTGMPSNGIKVVVRLENPDTGVSATAKSSVDLPNANVTDIYDGTYGDSGLAVAGSVEYFEEPTTDVDIA